MTDVDEGGRKADRLLSALRAARAQDGVDLEVQLRDDRRHVPGDVDDEPAEGETARLAVPPPAAGDDAARRWAREATRAPARTPARASANAPVRPGSRPPAPSAADWPPWASAVAGTAAVITVACVILLVLRATVLPEPLAAARAALGQASPEAKDIVVRAGELFTWTLPEAPGASPGRAWVFAGAVGGPLRAAPATLSYLEGGALRVEGPVVELFGTAPGRFEVVVVRGPAGAASPALEGARFDPAAAPATWSHQRVQLVPAAL